MRVEKTLDNLGIGSIGTIVKINSEDAIKRRLYDFGFIEGAKIKMLGFSPLGDPIAFIIKNTVIALRIKNCKEISVLKEVSDDE